MTTQDTHHEHNDADASRDAAVVEHPSAPENEMTVASASSETSIPAGTDGEEDKLSPASPPHGEDEAKANDEASASPTSVEAAISAPAAEVSRESSEAPEDRQGERPVEVQEPASLPGAALEGAQVELHREQHEEPVEQNAAAHLSGSETHVESNTPPSEAQQQELIEPVAPLMETDPSTTASAIAQEDLSSKEHNAYATEAPAGEEQNSPSSTAETSTPTDGGAKAEEVRPFTDFIAEFRQAEAALRDSQVEALSILSSVAADLAFVEPQVEEAPAFEGARPGDSSETTDKEDGVQVKIDETNLSSSSPEQNTATEAEPTPEKNTPQPAQPAARPVSPLLRPASRLRIPRHGVTRHQREEAASEKQTPSEAQPNAETQPASPASVEANVEAAPPRPARRYRFDRPATFNSGANGSGPAAQTSTAADSQTSSTLNGTGNQAKMEEAPAAKQEAAPPVIEPPVELPAAKPAVQETEPSTAEHSRRRHNNHKEQPAAAQPVEPVVQEPEPAPQPEEVAPEDLPPLEYSELQKASSRRRRRHRSGSSTVSAATSSTNAASSQPVQPVAPVVTPSAPSAPSAPLVPAQPPAAPLPAIPAARSITPEPNQSSYTIVSGYTVNQMNQGNDLSGPFMGPDPSPARGSVMTRDGRTVRAETRTAQPSAPIYPPARSPESGLSTAAMTQFANIVSQALQTQTDRMVSEFRRISQAPTNVSVTLPPFPSTERVGVFVDVANLLYSARTLRIGVDFGKLLDFLRGNRRLVRAHAYCPTSPQPGDEQMFLQAVKGLGYRITTKNYKTFSSGAKKADLDLDLCMDVVRLVDGSAVDCVVLVSGDSDFMPMLDYCSDHGVRVEVAAFDEAMSATLRQSCDLFINLSMLEEIRA